MGDVTLNVFWYTFREDGALDGKLKGGALLRKIVVDMQNRLFSDALVKILNESGFSFNTYHSEDPEKIVDLCQLVEADILILEVTNYSPWTFEERICLRNQIALLLPDCKIVFLVDEKTDPDLSNQVRQAKKDGQIHNFIYGSVSASYLSAIIDAL